MDTAYKMERQEEDSPMTPEQRYMIRYFLATTAFRIRKALEGAPDSFAGFNARPGVNSPGFLIHHMTQLMLLTRSAFGANRPDHLPELPWHESIDRLFTVLRELDADVAKKDFVPDTPPLEVLLQGPFTDILTHTGQLNILRRLSGHPVERTNFMKADIRIGDFRGPGSA